jgi:hypothetical protein
MIAELAEILETFPGFTHILNLVARSIIHQFDLPKSQADAALNAADQELVDLAEELNDEEMDGDLELEDDTDEDDVEGWVDEYAQMSEEDRVELDESIRPVKLVLAKVSLGIDLSVRLTLNFP